MSLYDLTGNKVSFTYGRLVQVASGSYYDGFGNPLDLSGSGTVLITGSTYPITSSWAITASYCLNSPSPITSEAVSASFYSSSVWEFTHSLNTTPILVQTYDLDFNQIIPQNILLVNLDVARISFPISASGYVIASRSGLLVISSSVGTNLTTGSTYPITSSWANNVVSASYSNNSTSASYSLTASYYDGSVVSSSYSDSSSYSNNSNSSSYTLSSSYAVTASYSLFAENSVNSQNAQDILVYAKNTSGAIIPKGKVVRIVGADNSSNNPTIELADFRNENDSANTLGFTNEEFSVNGFGYVITEGKLTMVNTGDFVSGDLLYLSSSGTVTTTTPHPPYHSVRLGEVLRSQNVNGSIYVRIDNGYELEELHNVLDTSTTSSYGDLLVKSGSLWINSKNLIGSYTLSGSLTTTSDINCTSVTASLYGTSSWSNNSLTASYLTPTNNYVVANLTSSNISVTGTIYASNFSASTIYITSSEYIVADNIITLNALNPYKRYAGLELHDSGSNNFSSILWDSQNNYLFVSSSETVGSRQIILGPDHEVNLISNYIPLISGSNTITSSIIYQNTGNIGIGTTSPSAKVDVVGDVQANAFYGKSFNLTTTSGQSAIFDTFTSTGTGEVYEVTIKGNPNAGESVDYQDVIYGKIIVGTGKTGSIATTFINYVQESPDPRLLYSSGGSSLTASVYFNSASFDVTQKGVGQSTPIRVVIGSYAVGYVGNNTTVRLKQIL